MCATHSHDDPQGDQRGPNQLIANLRQPGPLGWKLQRLFVNTWTKIAHRQVCCGHPGEPGC
jgi:hypothetical protein